MFILFAKAKKLINRRLVFGIAFLAFFLIGYWLWLDYRAFLKHPISLPTKNNIYTLKNGVSLNRLANQLAANGEINYAFYLKILAKLNPELKKLKVGEYQLEQPLIPIKLLRLLISGQVVQYSFTIIEGQTLFQVLQNLKSIAALKPLTEVENNNLKTTLAPDYSSAEGWLFPETYNFNRDESALSVLLRASTEMKFILQQEWQQRANDLPYDSAYQALIMASIIEKETGIASERADIAGVFIRRLEKKMRLQTDPTVIYGIGPSFNGDITRRDLKTPTPYNTYVIKGLPPTPIAMPSREAIYAALHPRDGKTLYFVADGTGGHYFSETLKEHQNAVNRMLKRNRRKLK